MNRRKFLGSSLASLMAPHGLRTRGGCRARLQRFAAAGVETGQVQRVQLLGMDRELPHRQDARGLTIFLPQLRTSDLAHAFKISGRGLVGRTAMRKSA